MEEHTYQGTTWFIRMRKAVAGALLAGLAVGGAAQVVAPSPEPVEEAKSKLSVAVEDSTDDPYDFGGGVTYASRATWS